MAPRGRGKFSKPSRGGGKRFSRDVQPVDKDGNRVGLWREPDDIASSDEDEDDDEDDESDSGSEDSAEEARGIPGSVPEIAMTREERRAAAKAKKQAAIARRNQVAAQPGDLPPSDDEDSNDDDDDEDDEDLPANPNHTAKSRSQLHKTASDAATEKSIAGDPSQLSRREREAIEAQQARERYLKLHAEGKTDEARADLARLAIIREKREAERLRKEAEKEEKAELAREKAAAREKREEGKGKKKGLKKK